MGFIQKVKSKLASLYEGTKSSLASTIIGQSKSKLVILLDSIFENHNKERMKQILITKTEDTTMEWERLALVLTFMLFIYVLYYLNIFTFLQLLLNIHPTSTCFLPASIAPSVPVSCTTLKVPGTLIY